MSKQFIIKPLEGIEWENIIMGVSFALTLMKTNA